ncbi:hypothetical protein V6N13_001257 [Hibiscus sabdariffa]
MAVSKTLLALILVSLLMLLRFAESADPMIVMKLVERDASYRRGRTFAREHAEHAAIGAIASLRAPPATMMCAHATAT